MAGSPPHSPRAITQADEKGAKAPSVADGGGDAAEFINIKVVDQNSSEVYFKLKRITPLQKLMDAYCTRQGLQASQVRFLFDGARVRGEQTPKELQMETDDMIDCVIAQVGG